MTLTRASESRSSSVKIVPTSKKAIAVLLEAKKEESSALFDAEKKLLGREISNVSLLLPPNTNS